MRRGDSAADDALRREFRALGDLLHAFPRGPFPRRDRAGADAGAADARRAAAAVRSQGGEEAVAAGVCAGGLWPGASVVDGGLGADLLIDEARFGEEEKDRARETGHSTAREAAQIALAAHAKRLVLSHVSARYSISAEELVREAK